MATAVTPRRVDIGFQFHLETEPDDPEGRRDTRLLIYGETDLFVDRVWVPLSRTAVVPHHNYIETVLLINGESVNLAINCKYLMNRLVILADAKIISFKDMQSACVENTFAKFIQDIQRPLCWKRAIIQCVGKGKAPIVAPVLLEFLSSNLPKWKEMCQKVDRVYIPSKDLPRVDKKKAPIEDLLPLLEFVNTDNPKWQREKKGEIHNTEISSNEPIPYDFEYCRDGSIWMYYSFPHLANDEIQSLVINLDTGEIYQTLRFSEGSGNRIRSFRPLFDNSTGILQFSEFFERDEVRDKGSERIFVARHQLYDIHLSRSDHRFTVSNKVDIACQLLEGLLTLENEKIVHCGISPQILIRFVGNGSKDVAASLTNFDYAYRLDSPEANIEPHFKWKDFPPPEGIAPLCKLSRPFAIPIYQLGMCLRIIFGDEPSLIPIFDKMIHLDPALRLTASQALSLLQVDRKESAL